MVAQPDSPGGSICKKKQTIARLIAATKTATPLPPPNLQIDYILIAGPPAIRFQVLSGPLQIDCRLIAD